MAPREDGRVDRLNDDLVAVRERLSRVETTMTAHEKAAEQRHRELLGLLEIVKLRGPTERLRDPSPCTSADHPGLQVVGEHLESGALDRAAPVRPDHVGHLELVALDHAPEEAHGCAEASLSASALDAAHARLRLIHSGSGSHHLIRCGSSAQTPASRR
ncbi:MAG: hypothetical protein KC621_28835 [Myxococcales bacterium]|nr:hypothetical protein [Myxococcales bacterium]